jgi:non-specific serine/threonine protein kinase
MDAAQRNVYDEYRRYYRDSLLQRIDTEGMAGAAIYVLEALLRLRQLCDHPKLVKNEAVKTDDSIKLQELRREIKENTGGRKVLVFSQFTEMLALIRQALQDDGVSYAYLDGKTPAAGRKEAVARFQTDPSVQVFLISLKAGGVGLNLTAAEYVYLVDPWWNPAVEAQAIDRTHRIGQTNKIVAYRMICKDTVEEKVMLLQARKRALAEGLVTEDAGFIKKLSREDVAFLLE